MYVCVCDRERKREHGRACVRACVCEITRVYSFLAIKSESLSRSLRWSLRVIGREVFSCVHNCRRNVDKTSFKLFLFVCLFVFGSFAHFKKIAAIFYFFPVWYKSFIK